MIQELKKEAIELILLFFLIFFGIVWCDIGNREAIHKQAEYEKQFICYDFEISDNFSRAIIDPDKKHKYKPKYRKKIYLKPY